VYGPITFCAINAFSGLIFISVPVQPIMKKAATAIIKRFSFINISSKNRVVEQAR
jgi:hypothetical protein